MSVTVVAVSLSEANSEPNQTLKMERLAEIVNGFSH